MKKALGRKYEKKVKEKIKNEELVDDLVAMIRAKLSIEENEEIAEKLLNHDMIDEPPKLVEKYGEIMEMKKSGLNITKKQAWNEAKKDVFGKMKGEIVSVRWNEAGRMRTEVYHKPDCGFIDLTDNIEMISRGEAEKRGLKPCSYCFHDEFVDEEYIVDCPYCDYYNKDSNDNYAIRSTSSHIFRSSGDGHGRENEYPPDMPEKLPVKVAEVEDE